MPEVLSTKPPLRPLMSMETAAKYIGLSLRHFRRLIQDNEVPIVEFEHGKRRTRFIKSAVLLDLMSRLAISRPKWHWDVDRIGYRGPRGSAKL